MSSSDYLQILSAAIDAHYQVAVIVYPIHWALKIAKKILSS